MRKHIPLEDRPPVPDDLIIDVVLPFAIALVISVVLSLLIW